MIFYPKKSIRTHHGFSLVEVIVALGIFAIVSIGIYSSIIFVFKAVYNSRLRIVESSVLNDQMEIIRNMNYNDVGIVNGSPTGVLNRIVTMTRDNIPFTITQTIRSVDDPYDGTIGGTPNDTDPADYKLVEESIICNNCAQKNPLVLDTTIAPKFLEGDPKNGALFIQVFDGNAQDIQGATVHVVASSVSPPIDLTDTTDNQGYLKLVSIPAGQNAYNITVTKVGYTSAQTISSTIQNPNPLRPPASVVAQGLSNVSFSINKVGTLQVVSEDTTCNQTAIGTFTLRGTKLIGQNPDVYVVNKTFSTNVTSPVIFSPLGGDAYNISLSGGDIIGTIPMQPIQLIPGVTQPVQIITGSGTINPWLVDVVNASDGQPVSNAIVTVTSSNGYVQTFTTGVGHIRQTDWSGGSGQTTSTDPTKYAIDDGHVDVHSSVGNMELTSTGGIYDTSGWLESSVYDLGISANFVNLVWQPLAQPIATGADSIRLQVAVSNSSTPATWNFVGSDGTNNTYYNSNNLALSQTLNGNRYFRYKVFLSTASSTVTPVLSDLSMNYVTACVPPGQAYISGLSAGTYSYSVSSSGYIPTITTTLNLSGPTTTRVLLQPT